MLYFSSFFCLSLFYSLLKYKTAKAVVEQPLGSDHVFRCLFLSLRLSPFYSQLDAHHSFLHPFLVTKETNGRQGDAARMRSAEIRDWGR